ncbi:MAG: DNA (cytosine-5-)-methyltransferase [Candidatus Binatia bacterium]
MINKQRAIPIVSLFSGPGGMDLGFQKAGFTTILALDCNEAAVNTYNLNDQRGVAQQYDFSQLTGDELVAMVRKVSADQPPHGVIGGPPCQSFSRANARKNRHDPRARLGVVFARLVKALNDAFALDFFVFENVVGLRSSEHSHRFRTLQRELRKAGFNLFVGDLEAGHFGVPQRRQRLFVVGINSKTLPWVKFQFPTGSVSTPTVREAIGELPQPIFYRRGLMPQNVPCHPNHWTMNPKSPKFRNGIQGSNGRSFKRLSWDKASLTVAYGNREIHVHPDGTRRLSVLEAMLLQGFPRDYILCGSLSDQITQISDAVPPPLAEAVAKAVRMAIYRPISVLHSRLLAWYRQHKRSFPWRQTTRSFDVLVAEKLLQQTAATDNVVQAFQNIVREYPYWKALARAREEDLAKIVEPLGLAYRAGELVKLAKVVEERYKGELPADLESLRSLPGIGDYCARALMSFSFGKPVAVVDTNVARFLVRYFDLNLKLTQNPARDRRLHHIADSLIPPSDSREFNLAILDLCAAHCKARNPVCQGCPLNAECVYRLRRVASVWPAPLD